MMQQPTGPENRPFSLQDAQTISAIVDNQPLQNGAAARQIAALMKRFADFCDLHLKAERKGPKEPREADTAAG